MSKNIWKCRRTGQCCKLFVFTGVQVSVREWELLEKDIKLLNLPKKEFEKSKSQLTLPIRGKKPPKRCREYPLMVQKYKDSVVFHISNDCPRGEELSKILQINPPQELKRIIGNRKVKVVLESFFEKGMQAYYDEEG